MANRVGEESPAETITRVRYERGEAEAEALLGSLGFQEELLFSAVKEAEKSGLKVDFEAELAALRKRHADRQREKKGVT